MPGGDRTGPSGMGARTGRGAGYCVGNPGPGFAYGGYGRGFGGRGGGRGGGWGGGRGGGYRWFQGGFGPEVYSGPMEFGTPGPNYPVGWTKEQEAASLKDQVKYFEDSLTNLKNRINELDAKTGD